MHTTSRARADSGRGGLNRHEGPGAGYRGAVSFNGTLLRREFGLLYQSLWLVNEDAAPGP
jgi:hypothetical protein